MEAGGHHDAAGRRAATAVHAVALGAAVAGFAAILAAWLDGGAAVDLPWVPALGLRLAFAIDGLGALFGLLATGVGAVVLAYARPYIRHHVAERGGGPRDEARFHALLLLFGVAMVGLVTAQDLVLLFVFWDLTALASYLLIGFDRDPVSRAAAQTALIVTAVSAILLLAAALLLLERTGTAALPEALERAQGGWATTAACLIAVAALAKSAQVPFHFWLPRAMVAPTPVSAYLHSAAMVAAGVFLLLRVQPLIEGTPALGDALIGVGLASVVVGGLTALSADRLKELLAGSTIAQYGLVVVLIGVGGEEGPAAAALFVLAHAVAKCALFLVAGSATRATGQERLDAVAGVYRRRPGLGVAAALAAAGLAGLPLTVGYMKDEVLYAATWDRAAWLGVAAAAGAALTLAYSWRFLWAGLRPGPAGGRGLPALMVAAPLLLCGAVVAGGLMPAPAGELATDAGRAALAGAAAAEPAYHVDARPSTVLALCAYAGGLALVSAPAMVGRGARAWARLGRAAGPGRAFDATLSGTVRASERLIVIEQRDLRDRLVAVLVPVGVLVGLTLATEWSSAEYAVGAVGGDDALLLVALAAAVACALAATRPREHLTLALLLSATGFSLALAFALFGAPDVALVAVLVEVALSLVVLGVLAALPTHVLRRERRTPRSPARRARDAAVAVVGAAVVFLVVWGALSRPAATRSAGAEQLRLAPAAHADNAVAAVVADFRGLDTLVEITVVVVGALGIGTLLDWGRGERR